MGALSAHELASCPTCGLIQRVPPMATGMSARCPRCGRDMTKRGSGRANSIAAAMCVSALILYPPAMILPVIEIQQLGYSKTTTVWGGVVELLSEGHVVIGLIVLACSVVVPPAKLLGVLLLCTRPGLLAGTHRAAVHRTVEFIGRWGMIDVLLVAVLVAAVKLGDWVSVAAGSGIIAFAGVVVFSLLASTAFEPASLWEET